MPASTLSYALNGASQADVDIQMERTHQSVSTSLGHSTSPIAKYHSLSLAKTGSHLARTGTGGLAKQLKPFATEDIKILLLENVNKTGRDILEAQGYQVQVFKHSLSEDELIEKIRCGSRVRSLILRTSR